MGGWRGARPGVAERVVRAELGRAFKDEGRVLFDMCSDGAHLNVVTLQRAPSSSRRLLVVDGADSVLDTARCGG